MVATTSQSAPTVSVDAALDHAEKWLGQRPDLALAQARAVLDVLPGHPRAQLVSGQALAKSGDLPAAHAVLSALAAEQPRSAATAHELGQICAALGDDAAAAAHLRRAVTLRPDSGASWTALAASLRELGREAEADDADLRAIRAATRDPQLVEAALALAEGRLEIAEPLLRARLRANPRDAAATRMLGELAWRLGREEDAITLLRRTLDLAPGFDAARELLCRVLSRTHRINEALAEAESLLARTPESAPHAMLKASLLVRLGDQGGARDLYAALAEKNPQQPKIWMNLGHVLKTLGEQAEAVNAYRRAITLRPALGEAWWSLANLKTVKFGPQDIAAMRQALPDAGDEEDALHLHFALGKALEDAGEHEAAFHSYAEGNRLRRAQLDYDAEETHRQSEEHAAIFTPAYIAGLSEGGCAARDPIFVLGLPRAGSTLVEQILASHSEIEGTMELPELMMIASRLEMRVTDGEFASLEHLIHALTPADRTRLGEEYIERTRLYRQSDKPRFIDKMPNNWRHVGLIRAILPHASVIDARRHPMGCCFSGWKQHFARGQAFSYDLGDIGRYYRDYVAQMAAFDAAAPGFVHRVIYEDMVADTLAQVERLLAFVGAPFEEACLKFWRNRRAVRTASSEQVRQPIFTDGVDHWRHFERWLAPLRDALGTVAVTYPDVPEDIAST